MMGSLQYAAAKVQRGRKPRVPDLAAFCSAELELAPVAVGSTQLTVQEFSSGPIDEDFQQAGPSVALIYTSIKNLGTGAIVQNPISNRPDVNNMINTPALPLTSRTVSSRARVITTEQVLGKMMAQKPSRWVLKSAKSCASASNLSANRLRPESPGRQIHPTPVRSLVLNSLGL